MTFQIPDFNSDFSYHTHMRSYPQDPPALNTNASIRLEQRFEAGSVVEDLAILGPSNPTPPQFTLEQSERYCRGLAAKHYENFTVVTYLYPTRFRQHLANIYAFCRWADDLADETSDSETANQLLDWWEAEFDRGAVAGADTPDLHPALKAVHRTIAEFGIPLEHFHDLIDAFRQDQFKVRYQSDAEVLDYCRRSANPVGRILLTMAGCCDEKSLSLSDHICTGLQIANFCQDLREDASRGRIYLPESRWKAVGISESEFADGFKNETGRQVLQEWVSLAQDHLRAGSPLVKDVPLWLARNLQMFIRGGLAITHAIEQSEYDVWNRSPVVSKWQKITILLQGLLFPRFRSFT